jgi:hypothetical protein
MRLTKKRIASIGAVLALVTAVLQFSGALAQLAVILAGITGGGAPTATTTTTAIFTVVVPCVTRWDIEMAKQEVESRGLIADPQPYPSNETRNLVIDQNPQCGTAVPKGRVVLLIFSAGSEPYPAFADLKWGSKVDWAPEGFEVRGRILNFKEIGRLKLYVLVRSESAKLFWVQSTPAIGPDGAWVTRVSFGEKDVMVGGKFYLVAIITGEDLTPGQQILELPPSEAVYSIILFRAQPGIITPPPANPPHSTRLVTLISPVICG